SPLYFFFSTYPAPLHLHSFPTRRSSDLAPEARPLNHSLWARLAFVVTGILVLFTTFVLLRGLPAVDPTANALRPRNSLAYAALEDRKSTRLNSSHRTISYAVFCLKKKTK